MTRNAQSNAQSNAQGEKNILTPTFNLDQVGKYEVSYISGVVHAPEESGLNPSLDVVPFAASALHKPVRVGTVKLMELRRVLEHEGFEVDVMAGCLRVGKSVLLKRVESGWVVHGRVGRVWRRVRDVLGAYVGVL